MIISSYIDFATKKVKLFREPIEVPDDYTLEELSTLGLDVIEYETEIEMDGKNGPGMVHITTGAYACKYAYLNGSKTW